MILDNDTLLTKCAEWGSYIKNGDPGGCMYGFSPGKGFRSATHATMVLAYVESHLRRITFHHTRQDLQDLSDICETALEYLKHRDVAFDAMLEALKATAGAYDKGLNGWALHGLTARAAIAQAEGQP